MGAAPWHGFLELWTGEGEGDVGCGLGDEGFDDGEVGGVPKEFLNGLDRGEGHDGKGILEHAMGSLTSRSTLRT